MFSRKGIVACFLVAALVVPAGATASKPSSGTGGNGSGVDQYVEKVPTAGGPKVVGAGKTKTVKLSKKTKAALKSANSKTRKRLAAIVTSSRYGAPAAKISPKDPTVGSLDSSVGGSLGAAIASFGAGSTARLVALLIAIVGTTVVVGIIAIRRQRVLP